MKPQSDQPYSLHSVCSRTRARSAARRRAEVRLGVRLDLLGREVALGRGVAELEAGVVVAGVLVVDQPDPVAVVDEVRGQQVVVARHGRPRRDGQRAAYVAPRRPRGRRTSAAARSRAPCTVAEVRRLAGEHVEVAGEPGPACSRRQASAARDSTPGSAKSASSSALPGQERDDQHRRGRAGTRPPRRPRPASAAARGVDGSRRPGRCPSSPASLCEQRTTMSSGSPSSVVVTRRLRLVSPPGRSVTRQDRPARKARRSRSTCWRQCLAVLEGLDDGRVDGRASGR